jgi:hypothetical protein
LLAIRDERVRHCQEKVFLKFLLLVSRDPVALGMLLQSSSTCASVNWAWRMGKNMTVLEMFFPNAKKRKKPSERR